LKVPTAHKVLELFLLLLADLARGLPKWRINLSAAHSALVASDPLLAY
jgi:hypothetical protein